VDRRNTFCGTVDYIAPEVINDESSIGYDEKCDVWQIAVLAFELVAGRTPFTDDGPRDEDLIMDNIAKVKYSDSISNLEGSNDARILLVGIGIVPQSRALEGA
jgi:serine/threonine protein kinase